ncbi:MAG TPA: PfkB family carbohydrate kinase [Candidatus Wallbacteria bacterium]|nr:PfkB family carbohydrate kinase [Candidatus Wallbacteria bacterium]
MIKNIKNDTFQISDAKEKEYLKMLAGFKKISVAVVGDIIADEYIYGSCERISREAPVLILRHASSKITPGGGGNAAANVAALGALVYSIGVVDNGTAASEVMKYYEKNGINTDYIIKSKKYDTCVKTRIMSGSLHTTLQQVIRIDRGGETAITEGDADALLEKFKKAVKKVDTVLISDYNCGLFTDYFTKGLQEILKNESSKRKIFVIVDSRHRLFDFKYAYTATPNESEAHEASGVKIVGRESLIKCGEILKGKTGNKTMVITRGSKGMAFFDEAGRLFELPITRRDEIADVTGAGDTVAATLSASLPLVKKTPVLAVELANIAGGAKVMKRGTAQVSADEIAAEITRIKKIQNFSLQNN